jgi:hypothetical protein
LLLLSLVCILHHDRNEIELTVLTHHFLELLVLLLFNHLWHLTDSHSTIHLKRLLLNISLVLLILGLIWYTYFLLLDHEGNVNMPATRARKWKDNLQLLGHHNVLNDLIICIQLNLMQLTIFILDDSVTLHCSFLSAFLPNCFLFMHDHLLILVIALGLLGDSFLAFCCTLSHELIEKFLIYLHDLHISLSFWVPYQLRILHLIHRQLLPVYTVHLFLQRLSC